ncbi:hypothetical protein C8J56DRAFT_325467 [Mycena floridula]|nr:hypothetical protein C8J56DRAFT_325467 [Mycena floridula]
MIRSWRFGQSQSSNKTSKPVEDKPSLSSADAKKFGLENFGNTCYANSVIQALYFCAPFRELVLQSADTSIQPTELEPPAVSQPTQPLAPVRRKPERRPSATGSPLDLYAPAGPPIPSSPPTLFSALRSLFHHISAHPAEKGTVAPKAFITKLKGVNDVFDSTMHQDAHEFLNYLLNKIVEEIEEERKLVRNSTPPLEDLCNSVATLASKTPPTVVTTSSNSGTAPQDATLVHKLFEGVLTSETRCLSCETVSSRDESFLDLSIDIEQNASVTACLRQFSASEMLCQKNKFFCDACCDLQEAEKRMKIKKLPNVLALHLKRFKYQEDLQKYIKLAYRVAFPFQLRLFNTVDDTDDADRLYNLFGIVVHIGNGPHHGHYISIIKTQDSWLVFDDDNVYPITEGDIPKYFGDSNSGSAYVLYYQAADIDLPALGIHRPPIPEPIPRPTHVPFETSSDPASVHSTPVLPPGLVEEGDSSDLSDPAYPITPSHSSPLPASIPAHLEKSRQPVDFIAPHPDDVGSASSTAPIPIPPPINTLPSFISKTLGRSPSTSRGRSDPRDVDPKAFLPPPPPPPLIVPSPPSPSTNGAHQEPSRKPSMWFKRKSLRVGDKKYDVQDLPASPVASTSDHTASSSSNSSAWYRTTAGTKEKDQRRRPSEPSLFSADGFHTGPSRRPKSSNLDNLSVDRNGSDSPSPGSASSSLNSTSFPPIPPPPPIAPPLSAPPPRSSSLGPDKVPEHKKSLSSLVVRKEKKERDNRPATASGTTPVPRETAVRPLPPVPPLPVWTPMTASPVVDDPEDFVILGGHEQHASEPSRMLFPSTSVGPPTNGNLKQRATRKLSLTAPILGGLGFGKKEKKEKDLGLKAPSAFPQFSKV